MSTLKTINVVHPSSSTNNIVTDANGNVTVGGTVSMASSFLRNRVINGAMEIDQRNAGASVTQSTTNQYPVDRFFVVGTVASKFTAQRSTTTPTGFVNSIICTSSSAYSVGSSETFIVAQRIEGLNVTDLAWGTASAKTVTLSFWARSSLTGTFGGSVRNDALNRSYPFSYAITSADTWEYKTITIPGDTSGTWLTDNSVGVSLVFSLGTGTTLSGTANTWAGANYLAPTGAVSVVGTNGATFCLTGVQLEVGSVATPFERRLRPTELQLAQRYFETSYNEGVAVGTATTVGLVGGITSFDATLRAISVSLKVPKRATPTMQFWDGAGNASRSSARAAAAWTSNLPIAALVPSANSFVIDPSGSSGFTVFVQYAANAEL